MLHKLVIAIGGLAVVDLILVAWLWHIQNKRDREQDAPGVRPMTDCGPGIPPAPPPTSQ